MNKLLIMIVSISISAVASDFGAGFFPTGEKELFTGNAGIGGIGSATAGYYNPGALTQIKNNKLSVTASSFYYMSQKREPTMAAGGKEHNYESSSFNTIPSSLVTVYNFDAFTGSFTIMVPFNYSFENQQVWEVPGRKLYFQEKKETSDLWVGPTAAFKLNDRLSVGASLFAVKAYSLQVDSYVTRKDDGTESSANSRRFQANVWGAIAIIGAHWEGDLISFGARAQSPYIQINGVGDYFNSSVGWEGGSYRRRIVNRREIDANYELPADFGVGVNIHLTDKLDLLIDTSYSLKMNYNQYEDAQVIAEGDGVISDKPSFRHNVGVEFRPTEKIDLMAGAYTFSGLKNESLYCVSFGGYYLMKQTRSGLGFFIFNLNEEEPADPDEGLTTPPQTTIYAFGAVLSTSYSF